ncbi:MAG: IS1634 family transposase [Thermoplasmatota archaeon]
MISTYTLNHFGIVSGICQELNIAGIIDTLIPSDPQQKVSTGQSIVSMIINGLGFSNRRLYLYPQFFENKPVNLLIGDHISADELNDDTIGRALDRIFQYGCTELFCSLSYIVAEHQQVQKKFGHLDTTTFSVHGEYDCADTDDAVIRITRGRSKQKRPDLKQIFLNLLVSFDGGVPLFMQALDGNSSDSVTFRETVSDFRSGIKKHVQEITYLIADSKFYAEETLKLMKQDVLWISRVPETVGEAKRVIEETEISELSLLQEDYLYTKHRSFYGDVEQRWLIVYSKHALKRAVETVDRRVKKEYEQLKRKVKTLRKKEFFCQKDACDAWKGLKITCMYHTVTLDRVEVKTRYKRRGRPSLEKNHDNKKVTFIPHYRIILDERVKEREVVKKAMFVIATNELSERKLSDGELLSHYKDQQKVENGFRFLKDPLFFASSLFLKKPERIVALTMIMCLSLLVYSIGERKLRGLLKEYGETIKNQVNKPTQKPTLRWIFQLFEDVHYVEITEGDTKRCEVHNLRPEGEKALRILGSNYMKPYLLEC